MGHPIPRAGRPRMSDDVRMDWLQRLGRTRRLTLSVLEERLATADKYARQLTETGSRCHLNGGRTRFCHWSAAELRDQPDPGDTTVPIGVRCTVHPGGRFLDSTARLDPAELEPPVRSAQVD